MQSKSKLGLSLATVGLAALMMAPGAQAVPFDAAHDTTCENAASISGAGASFQRVAQLGWGAAIPLPLPASPQQRYVGFGYHAGAGTFPNGTATCSPFRIPGAPPSGDNGTKTIEYHATGSGSGRTAVNATTAPLPGPRNLIRAFGASDEAPTAAQIANANEGDPTTTADDGNLHTIPNAQGAVVAALRIPDGCEIAISSARQISSTRLDGFFSQFDGPDADSLPDFRTWGHLFGFTNFRATAGEGLTNAQCQNKVPKRVVRLDDSGTTFAFKKYLHAAGNHVTRPGSGTDWNGVANQVWPANDPGSPTEVVRGATSGNAAVLTALDAQGANGGIGYSDLGGARSHNGGSSGTPDNGYGWTFTGGKQFEGGVMQPDDRKIWVRLQGIAYDGYVSPALRDDQEAVAGLRAVRCANVTFDDIPVGANPTLQSWFDVDAITTPADYPLCALTYGLTFDSLVAVGFPGTTAQQQAAARTRKDYFGFWLDHPEVDTLSPIAPATTPRRRGTGSLVINGYGRLPVDLLTISRNAFEDLEA